MRTDWEPGLVEEAVLRTVGARPDGRLFYREREAVYTIADAEDRARAFDTLAARWFVRLGLGRPVDEAVGEHRIVRDGVGECVVGRPPRPNDAGAELLVRVADAGEPIAATRLLRLLITTEMLLDPARATTFLRRELLHVADMIDPCFAYVPELPTPGGPGRQRLLRDRYRVIWDATVDGRLLREGRLEADVRGARRAEFLRAFGWMGSAAEHAFDRFFDDDVPTHAAIAAFATVPGGHGHGGGASVCGLCGFMTTALERGSHGFGAAVEAEITGDFPDWRPDDGCCPQCAELYRARPLSRAGAAALPGIR